MPRQNELNNFWSGAFGDEYVERHEASRLLPAKRHMFNTMLADIDPPTNILEFGTNQGLNLLVLNEMFPESHLFGIEINAKAAALARKVPGVRHIANESFLEHQLEGQCDLSFTAGVLIHLSPDALPQAYEKLYQSSRRHILMVEYHNPSPLEIPYRGHTGKLYARDFAGEMLDAYPALTLMDYGFFYKRDRQYGLGDVHWFLLHKTNA